MLKQLFILLFRLITDPISSWEKLSEKQETDNENFYKSYLFPIFGIIALFSFVGILLTTKTFDVQLALKTVIKQLIVYGGGFYLASQFLFGYIFPRFELEKDKLISERFVGYSSSVVYVVAMLHALFPNLFLLEIFTLYTIYIIWIGASRFLGIKENQWIKFTIFASVLIMLIPFLLYWIVSLVMPGLKT